MLVRESMAALNIVVSRPGFIKLLESFLAYVFGIHIEPILAFLDMGSRWACLFEYSLQK